MTKEVDFNNPHVVRTLIKNTDGINGGKLDYKEANLWDGLKYGGEFLIFCAQGLSARIARHFSRGGSL